MDIRTLRPHEETVEERVRELVERIEREGVVTHPVIADARTGLVVDGHHRLEALRRLRATRIPAHLVDYLSPQIALESWDPRAKPPSKEDVLAHAVAGKLFPPKTTRHPNVYGLGEVRVELSALREAAGRVSVAPP